MKTRFFREKKVLDQNTLGALKVLPDEMILQIVSELDELKDKVNFSETCKIANGIVKRDKKLIEALQNNKTPIEKLTEQHLEHKKGIEAFIYRSGIKLASGFGRFTGEWQAKRELKKMGIDTSHKKPSPR